MASGGRPRYLDAFVCVFVALSTLSTIARGQDVLLVDLATAKERDTVMIAVGRYTVRTSSRVPRFTYSVRVAQRTIPIAPFNSVREPEKNARLPCTALRDVITGLNTVNAEEEVPALLTRATTARASEGEGCPDEVLQVKQLTDTTEVAHGDTYNLQANQYLIVTVSRSVPGSTLTRQWERVYTTGDGSGWRTTFGFAFLQTTGIAKGGAFADATKFFTQSLGDSAKRFVIKPEAKRQSFDAVPTVIFSYARGKDRGLQWNPLTASLGLDLTNPFVTLGTGLTYNSNLHLTLGLAARREDVLLGRYQPGDTVATDLTASQLTAPTFRLRPLFAITLRFLSNPFVKAAAPETTPAKTEAQPEAKPAPTL